MGNDGKSISAAQLVQKSKEIDPVQIFSLDMGTLNSNGEMSSLALGTSGSVLRPGSDEVEKAILEVIEKTVDQPFAWIGESYVGMMGAPLTFDASGSYDPKGYILQKYEWDFEGDGIYDRTTTVPTVSKTYAAPFSGLVGMRVTSAGGISSIATAQLLINEDGSVPQLTDEEDGDLDADDLPLSSLYALLYWLRQDIIAGSPSKLDKTIALIGRAEADFFGGIKELRLEAALLLSKKTNSKKSQQSTEEKGDSIKTEALKNIIAVTKKIMDIDDDVPLSSLDALLDLLRQDVVSGSPSNLDKTMDTLGQAGTELVAGIQRLNYDAQDYLTDILDDSPKKQLDSKSSGSFKRETLTRIVTATNIIISALGNTK